MKILKVVVEVRASGLDPEQAKNLGRLLARHARGEVCDYLNAGLDFLGLDGAVSVERPTFFVDSSHSVEAME